MAAKSTRPAAATPPSVATIATSFAEPGPDSSHAAPATTIAAATRRSARLALPGSSAAQAPAPKTPSAASRSAERARRLDGCFNQLGKDCLQRPEADPAMAGEAP